MLFEQSVEVVDRVRHPVSPLAESAVGIYCTDPFLQEGPLRLILIGVLGFHLQDECCAVSEPHQEVGAILADAAAMGVENLES